MGKKRDPVDIKYDAIDAEAKRMFKTIIRNAKTATDKKHDELIRLMEESRKEDRALYDEATDNMLLTVSGIFQQARLYEKMTDPVIKDLEARVEMWEGRAHSNTGTIKRLRDENAALRKEHAELKALNTTLMNEWNGSEGVPKGYFDDE